MFSDDADDDENDVNANDRDASIFGSGSGSDSDSSAADSISSGGRVQTGNTKGNVSKNKRGKAKTKKVYVSVVETFEKQVNARELEETLRLEYR